MKHEQCTIGGASQPPSTLLAGELCNSKALANVMEFGCLGFRVYVILWCFKIRMANMRCIYTSAVSRSFGDRDLKSEGLISATPEVILLPLSPELRFVVLACDGVWDALSDQARRNHLYIHRFAWCLLS